MRSRGRAFNNIIINLSYNRCTCTNLRERALKELCVDASKQDAHTSDYVMCDRVRMKKSEGKD